MPETIKTKVVVFLMVILTLTACTPAAIQSTTMPWPTYTSYPTYTPMTTQTPYVVVVMATSSPAPKLERWTADQVINAFVAAGLEAENSAIMTKDDYGFAPMMAKKGIRFLIPSLCADCGGRVMEFDDQQSLEIVKAYYEDMGKSSAAFFSWVYVKDNILVQINGDLPADQAAKYEQALDGLN